MFVTSAQDVRVRGNFIAYHPFGVRVMPERREALPPGFDTCRESSGIVMEGNTVIASGGPGRWASMLGDPRRKPVIPPCPSNRVEHNRVGWDSTAQTSESGVERLLSEEESRLLLAEAGIPAGAP